MAAIKVTQTIELELSLETAAEWFANLDDDQQARFFVAVAKQAEKWNHPQGIQWFAVGSHLRNCECSSWEARDLVREMHNGLENGTHQ